MQISLPSITRCEGRRFRDRRRLERRVPLSVRGQSLTRGVLQGGADAQGAAQVAAQLDEALPHQVVVPHAAAAQAVRGEQPQAARVPARAAAGPRLLRLGRRLRQALPRLRRRARLQRRRGQGGQARTRGALRRQWRRARHDAARVRLRTHASLTSLGQNCRSIHRLIIYLFSQQNWPFCF